MLDLPSVSDHAVPAADDSTTSIRELERSLTVLIRALTLPRVHQRVAALAGEQVDRSSYLLLVRLAALGPARVGDLAEVLGVDPSTVSRQLRALGERGYVVRANDPADGRAALVTLSQEGSALTQALQRAREAFVAEALGDWSPTDLEACSALLGRLADAIAVSTNGTR